MTVEVRAHRLGASLRLAVRPGAPKTRVLGEHGGALKLAVAGRAERGRANKAALRYLAGALNLPRAGLEMLSGEFSREKVILCRGLAPADLRGRVAGLLEE